MNLLVCCFGRCRFCLLLSNALLDEGVVLCLLFLLAVDPAAVEGTKMTAALQTHGCNKSLDFRSEKFGQDGWTTVTRQGHSRLGVRLRVFLLSALHLSADDVLPHIVLLAKIEEFSYLGCSLRPKTLGQNVVRESRNIGIALLDDDEREDGDVWANDAATHGLAPALTVTAGAVAGVAVGKEKTNTVRKENTLFHGETLLVVPTSDAKDVAGEFIAKGVSLDLLGNFLVVEDTAEECRYRE